LHLAISIGGKDPPLMKTGQWFTSIKQRTGCLWHWSAAASYDHRSFVRLWELVIE